MTGSVEGRSLLYKETKILDLLTKLTSDNMPGVARDACLALVNLSADEEGSLALLSDKVMFYFELAYDGRMSI